MNTELKKVMVIGGGIAGLTAAWELSKLNVHVELIEKDCFLGGHAIKYACKATDKCQQCGACSVEAMLKNVDNEPLINVHLATEIDKVNRNGKFKVTLKKSTMDFSSQSLLQGFSKNNSPLYVITDKDKCENIPEGAVELSELGSEGEIDVDAVIMASGFKPFDAKIKSHLNYENFSNVISGIDVERIKRENGEVLRPSDGKVPEKIAFIQCVGSRDDRLGNLWCSKVCCAYGLRTAQTLKYQNPEAEITVFYMDIQNVSKDYPAFYEKCKSDFKFVRTIPADIYPLENDNMLIRHMNEDDGVAIKEEFDLIVLSVGIMPGENNSYLSETFGLDLNESGFFSNSNGLNSALTSKEGVFLAGTTSGPSDIATSIAQSGQTASEVIKYLGGA